MDIGHDVSTASQLKPASASQAQALDVREPERPRATVDTSDIPAPTRPSAPPPLRTIGQGWGVDGGSVRGRVRERFTVTCPPQ